MAGGFHPKDIERIKSKDIWLQRFLEQEDLDPDASLKMLWGSCKWRKEFGANGTVELFLRISFFKLNNPNYVWGDFFLAVSGCWLLSFVAASMIVIFELSKLIPFRSIQLPVKEFLE